MRRTSSMSCTSPCPDPGQLRLKPVIRALFPIDSLTSRRPWAARRLGQISILHTPDERSCRSGLDGNQAGYPKSLAQSLTQRRRTSSNSCDEFQERERERDGKGLCDELLAFYRKKACFCWVLRIFKRFQRLTGTFEHICMHWGGMFLDPYESLCVCKGCSRYIGEADCISAQAVVSCSASDPPGFDLW